MFSTVAAILFREQTQLFGKQLYVTIHYLVLLFVFLPADRHVMTLRSEFVVYEDEIEAKV